MGGLFCINWVNVCASRGLLVCPYRVCPLMQTQRCAVVVVSFLITTYELF
jgi:hypothetical protein